MEHARYALAAATTTTLGINETMKEEFNLLQRSVRFRLRQEDAIACPSLRQIFFGASKHVDTLNRFWLRQDGAAAKTKTKTKIIDLG